MEACPGVVMDPQEEMDLQEVGVDSQEEVVDLQEGGTQEQTRTS